METKVINFEELVEECLENVRTRALDDTAGFRVSPAMRNFLSCRTNQEIIAGIVGAANPAVKRLLTSDEELGLSITSLIQYVDNPTQGVFANILINDDESAIRIFVGAAAGPYKARSAGMRGRIQGLQAEIKRTRSSTVLHFQIARAAGWRTNWAMLIAFRDSVEKEMVLVAQAIMAILLGSCPRQSYIACRPKYLKPPPKSWGLNEMGPLGLDGLASYHQGFDTMDPEEAMILHRIRATGTSSASSTAGRRRQARLTNGGPIRVYVLWQDGLAVRFHVTLLTAKDGAHVDVNIPLLVGLEYGLQISREANIRLELTAKNHHAPFAMKAAYNSEARRLGIILSGIRAVGPLKGVSFTHWLQSPRRGVLFKAEKLVQFLNRLHCSSDGTAGDDRVSKYVSWSGHQFLSTWERLASQEPIPPDLRTRKVDAQDSLPTDAPQGFYEMLLETTKALQKLSQSRKIRATPDVRAYFQEQSAEAIATMITTAVRPQVVDLLISTTDFTVPRLLSIGGNLRDESQGIYADVVTNEQSDVFKLYVGAAGSSGGRRYAGLRRRIQEHLRSARSRTTRAQSGELHHTEMTKPGAHPNFVVLLRFSKTVPIPVVHIAEALMTIFFASWENRAFLGLRPKHLAEYRGWALNKANPMDYGIVNIYDLDRVRSKLAEGARRKAARLKAKSIQDASSAQLLRTYPNRARKTFCFRFCAETIFISATLGHDLDLKNDPEVLVECETRPEPHPCPYALKAPWKSNARRLAIFLRGKYNRGVCKGQEFKRWVQCDSQLAIARAERITARLEGWSLD